MWKDHFLDGLERNLFSIAFDSLLQYKATTIAFSRNISLLEEVVVLKGPSLCLKGKLSVYFVPSRGSLCLAGGLLGSLRWNFWWHILCVHWQTEWVKTCNQPELFRWGHMQISGLKTPSMLYLGRIDPDMKILDFINFPSKQLNKFHTQNQIKLLLSENVGFVPFLWKYDMFFNFYISPLKPMGNWQMWHFHL